MKPRRCGRLHGISGWKWLAFWHVRFARKNRWCRWRPYDVMASIYADASRQALAAELKELLVKKIDPRKVKQSESLMTDLKGLEKLPMLKAFLTDPVLETDTATEPREPGTIYIQPRDGELAITLKEPSQALMLRLSAPSIQMVWPAIEAALDDASSLWESDPWAKRRKKKK